MNVEARLSGLGFSVRGSLGTEDYCREVEVGGFVGKDRGRWNWDGALLLVE